jgi:hypothetical protein
MPKTCRTRHAAALIANAQILYRILFLNSLSGYETQGPSSSLRSARDDNRESMAAEAAAATWTYWTRMGRISFCPSTVYTN